MSYSLFKSEVMDMLHHLGLFFDGESTQLTAASMVIWAFDSWRVVGAMSGRWPIDFDFRHYEDLSVLA